MGRPYSTHPTTAPRAAAIEASVAGGDGSWALSDPDGPCRTWPLASGVGCIPERRAQWTALHFAAVEDATDLLWRLTAGRFGLCRETVRPGREQLCAGALSGYCRCPYRPILTLPGPVYTDPPGTDAALHGVEVWIDGALVPGPHRVLSGNRLARAEAAGWPGCQDLTRPLRPGPGDAPDAAAGTFGIVYWRGRPVPPGGRRSVALLACELHRAMTQDENCRIPDRVQLVERQGVTYRMIDRQEFLSQGRVGITEIDTWLSSVNPRARRSPAAVFSPDIPAMASEPMSSAYPDEMGG